ncbi:MAG TPA: AarF/ABC1/UbiB kinase family protein [Sneathiellales bacterium]|nr:AarF/ABC1/UbiB kinase family protein [Sneathiellales bacterium]
MANDDLKDFDQNSLGGRVRRYVRVSTAVGGLAARLAGERLLGIEIDRGRHAADLRMALGGLKGPLMKVAQIMATVPDVLPTEYVMELGQLQSNAPSMGWSFVKRRMATELGPNWQDRFACFDRHAVAAASLGQVHKATAAEHPDLPLAAKLQYPDMQSAVEADLRQLKLVFGAYRRYDPSIDPSQIQLEIGSRLREELDYQLEARHTDLFRYMLADEPNVHVPEVVSNLSTKRLLILTWLEGRPLLDFREASQEQRDALALNMFRAWWVPFYRFGVIHGDPHLGNYTVREDLSVNLLDYGCVRVFPTKFVGGVVDLYRALETDDWDLAVHAYETWGFKDLSREIIEVLNLWAQFLYGPLLDDRRRPIHVAYNSDIDPSATVYGREVAAKVHSRLRELGSVAPPREFVFMDRAAIGLAGVFLHLGAKINWHRLFNELIHDLDMEVLQQRQTEALVAAGVTLP